MLQIKDVTKKYKKYVVFKNITLDFWDNSLNVLVGPSGSGKTTLLNILGALDYDNTGELYFNDKLIDNKNIEAYRNSVIGFVFQKLNIIETITLRDNFKLAYDLAKIEYNTNELYDILTKVNLINHIDDLEWFLDKKPNQLSLGQLQRCSIARALIKKPKILILDEPTSALDEENSIQLMDLLKDLAKDRIIIMSSHNKYIVENYADKIISVNDKTAKIIKDYDCNLTNNKSDNNWYKGILSFKSTFRLAINTLAYNKVKLITSVLLTLISMLLFSISYLFQTYDKIPVLLNTQYKYNDLNGFVFNLETVDRDGSLFDETESSYFNYEQTQIIKKYSDGVYSPYFLLRRHELYNIELQTYDVYSMVINHLNAIEMDTNEDISKFGLGKSKLLSDNVKSRLPENFNEIAITDFYAQAILNYGVVISDNGVFNNIKPRTADEIIGMKIGDNLTVSGIFSSDDDVFELWTDYYGKDHINMPEDEYDYYNSLRNGHNLSTCHIFKKGYFKANSYLERGLVHAYYVRLKGNYKMDKAFLDSLNMDNMFIIYHNTYSGFTNIVNFMYNNSFTTKLWIFIGLCLLISILVSINLFHTNIKGMEKELGILKSIGSSNKSILNIILLQASLICLLEYIISIIIIGIILKMLNNSLVISMFTISPSCAFLMFIIIFGVGILVSLISSINTFKNKPINIIEKNN